MNDLDKGLSIKYGLNWGECEILWERFIYSQFIYIACAKLVPPIPSYDFDLICTSYILTSSAQDGYNNVMDFEAIARVFLNFLICIRLENLTKLRKPHSEFAS